MARSIKRHRLPHVFPCQEVMSGYGRIVVICCLLTLALGGCERVQRAGLRAREEIAETHIR